MNAIDRPMLLLEDSPEDTEATLRALKRSGVTGSIYHCQDGEDGMDFLHHRGKYSHPHESPRPCVILLDLNLPGTDGREVLAEIKGDAELRSIPVVVLTTSTDARDIENCYRMGANSYIKKAVDFERFAQSIQRFRDYWFDVVVLPRGN